MKTYNLVLTAEELKVVSQAIMALEQAAIKMDAIEYMDEDFTSTVLKVSDLMENYYTDNGITD